MRIFDPHIHMTSRTTDDYTAMAAAGVRAIVEPAFWLGQPRTNPGSFADYFDSLIGWEPYRAAKFGIRHHATIALNPKEAGDPRCRPVLDLLPRYLDKDGVVAVGEIGYDSMIPEEDEAFAVQLALAVEYGLPALVHTPHRDKARGTLRVLVMLDTKRPEFYSTKPGAAPGFDSEILDLFGRFHKVKIETVTVGSWDALIPALNDKKGDLIAGRFSATDSRKKLVDFTSDVPPTDTA